MNDILHIDPLYVDNVCRLIKRIEGRTGDTLILPSKVDGKTVSVFSDVIERSMSRSLVGRYAYL